MTIFHLLVSLFAFASIAATANVKIKHQRSSRTAAAVEDDGSNRYVSADYLGGGEAAVHQPRVHYETLEERLHYNLLLFKSKEEEDVIISSESSSSNKCTIEWMNAMRLQQDHPCVVETIQRHYLHRPNSMHNSYRLDRGEEIDPSVGQARSILRHLLLQREGFFVEAGALDGEELSNTLLMERSFNWTGLLIEANFESFRKLINKNRRAHSLPVCLSPNPYPIRVEFETRALAALSHINSNDSSSNGTTTTMPPNARLVQVQCFPLYSILLAVGQTTTVDFLSLDVEGAELQVLDTIPWHRIDIKTLAVEYDHVGKEKLTQFMANHGYRVFEHLTVPGGKDLLFTRTPPPPSPPSPSKKSAAASVSDNNKTS